MNVFFKPTGHTRLPDKRTPEWYEILLEATDNRRSVEADENVRFMTPSYKLPLSATNIKHSNCSLMQQ